MIKRCPTVYIIVFLFSLAALTHISHCENVTVPLAEDTPALYACQLSLWGVNCSFNCSVNCRNKTCDSDSGFCFCEDGAPQMGCSTSPEEFLNFVTRFWLIVCALSFVGAIMVLVLGVKCQQRSVFRKRKVLNVVFKKSNNNKIDTKDSNYSFKEKDAKSQVARAPPDTVTLRKVVSTISKEAFSTTTSGASGRNASRCDSLFRGRIGGSVTSGTASVRRKRSGTIASSNKTEQVLHVKKSSLELAKQLTQAMPEFKVQVDKAGNITLERKQQGKAIEKEAIKKAILLKTQRAQEKARKKPVIQPQTNGSERQQSKWKFYTNKILTRTSGGLLQRPSKV